MLTPDQLSTLLNNLIGLAAAIVSLLAATRKLNQPAKRKRRKQHARSGTTVLCTQPKSKSTL